jgi:endogenous inhibitor of DNA gyrase (YacG/DUF329 family)
MRHKDTECPYCGAGVEINHDDGYGYSEDDTHKQECGECGKTFAYTTTICFYYRPRKANCLNGGEHQYEKTKTYPPEYARLRCTACGHEKPLTANAEVTGAPLAARPVD